MLLLAFLSEWINAALLLCGYVNSGIAFPKALSREEEQKYIDKYINEGDMSAKNILIEHNLRLVAHIAKKYSDDRNNEDLISIGTIGLIKGINTYRPEKTKKLSSYISRCVENEILMYFRAQRKSAQDVSLSDYIETGSDGAALSLMDVVSEDDDLLEQVTTREAVRQLRQVMDTCLTDQERQVVTLRYGLDGEKPKRQREVALLCGISRSYISRPGYCKR